MKVLRTAILYLLTLYLPICLYSADSTIEFWNTQRKGANFFNNVPTEKWFKDASELGVEWVRLTYDKWDPEYRDFLLGDASSYQSLIQKDLNKLKQVIEWADKYDMKLVITPLSLPGSRYLQNNDFQPDLRLWDSYDFWEQAVQFWTDLASELKGYNNIVAYNIINEPSPELGTGTEEHVGIGDVSGFIEWYSNVKNTPRDIYKFYSRVIEAIAKQDPEAVVMLDAGWYGQPGAFCYWVDKFESPNVLYAFHMYEPYAYTSHHNFTKKNNYDYPGKVPFGADTVYWDKHTIEAYFEPFLHWAMRNDISSNRVVAGEFGVMRRNKGAERYLLDVIAFLNERNFHWAFYSYREDAWDGYDYELGSDAVGWEYWQAIERGENPALPRRGNPIFDVIKKEFGN